MVANSQIVGFEWKIQSRGYTCIEATPLAESEVSDPNPELVPAHYQSLGKQMMLVAMEYSETRVYSPLQNEALFQTFARTEPTAAGVVGFANQYGDLGNGALGFSVAVENPPGTKARHSIKHGEPLEFWKTEIHFMRIALEAWRMARSGDTDGSLKILSKVFEIPLTQREIYEPLGDAFVEAIRTLGPAPQAQKEKKSGISTGGIELPEIDPIYETIFNWLVKAHKADRSIAETLNQVHAGDLIGPTFGLVQIILNNHLRYFSSSLIGEVKWQPESRKMTFQISPHTLLGALWLQFSQAVSGDKAFQSCIQCGTLFEIAQGRRKSRMFCSDACRFKAYRERQTKARELHSKGVPIEGIARELDSKPKTIKGWLGKG